MDCVRVLVDGNNLTYALRDVGPEGAGRSMLCRLLGEFAARTGLAVAVVFDGAAPAGNLARQIADARIAVHYSGHRSADEVLAELIAAHSAPRSLTVISTDHDVQRHARHRRCHVVASAAFAARLVAPAPPKCEPVEPPEKRAGLDEGETQQWLKEFGLTDSSENE